ncbi:hypothetical protein O6P37_15890 [Mycobacterium sp. CPCC 205372]|uniref:Uncharacterized protein n=1 Tax=Mycobacterium hippophais TaxID=3016340 RepID=A0ABT4PUV1_9MYCO|nr:hypothetical protein [Mycobacterium hippophais]MCZ8380350.1 hypothetical protein [Mycobacterium hippophais]
MTSNDLRQFLQDPVIADYISRMTAQAPPLSARQRAALIELLRPVQITLDGCPGGDAA